MDFFSKNLISCFHLNICIPAIEFCGKLKKAFGSYIKITREITAFCKLGVSHSNERELTLNRIQCYLYN